MNEVKKVFLMMVTVFSVLIFCGMTFAQDIQTVTLVPSGSVVSLGASFDVNVDYDCTKKVSNFSIEVYYDANIVTFEGATVNYDQGILVNPPEHNATEHKIVISYLDIMGQWPSADLPLENVVTLKFVAGSTGYANFTIVDKVELPNVIFVGEPVGIAVGGASVGYIEGTIKPQNISTTITTTGGGYAETLSDGSYFMTHDPGTFTLTAQAEGYETFSTTVAVEPMETTKLDITLTPICDAAAILFRSSIVVPLGETVIFETTGSKGELLFDYGDGTPVSADTTHIYTVGGIYTVTLTATGTDGCTDTATQSVTVEGICDAVAAFTTSTNGLTVNFNTTGSAGTLSFDYGDGSTGAATTHTYAAAGTYTVTLTATGTGECTDTASRTVTATSSVGGYIEGTITPNVQTIITTTGGGYAETLSDGSYFMTHDPGTFTLTAQAEGYEIFTTTVTVEPMETTKLDITLTVRGDANGDGQIDINDALMVAQYDVGLLTEDEIPGFEAADTDCNGKVDIMDALRIAMFDVGLLSVIDCNKNY